MRSAGSYKGRVYHIGPWREVDRSSAHLFHTTYIPILAHRHLAYFFFVWLLPIFFTMHIGRAILLSYQYWTQAKDSDLILALVYVVCVQCALKSLNASYYDAVYAVSYVFPYLRLSRVFLRYIGKPHKRCSGLFSVALSSELDAAIVTKCHGIKICQEFHRECQTYVIPPAPSILPTKRYS